MFRSRFNDAFSSKLGHFGPQDIERGVVDAAPSPQVEALLCALLALVLNRLSSESSYYRVQRSDFELLFLRIYHINVVDQADVCPFHRRGHYGRALEEALLSHKSQWPRAWGGVNPISGGRSFYSMSPDEKVGKATQS
jgi:hypothetical protein